MLSDKEMNQLIRLVIDV